jgi:hypothetical protein
LLAFHREDVTYLYEKLAAVTPANLAAVLELTHNDPAVNAQTLGESDDPVMGVARFRLCDESRQFVARNEPLNRLLVSLLLDERLSIAGRDRRPDEVHVDVGVVKTVENDVG